MCIIIKSKHRTCNVNQYDPNRYELTIYNWFWDMSLLSSIANELVNFLKNNIIHSIKHFQ